ncbi:MAG: S41 family peptidase, partial [bacterium]|nr:S41 family peptidase [bacterium]
IIASVLKKYNAGVLVGTKTKGWGTIERVFDLKTQLDVTEKYSLFLVHTITLREDGQPIEGRGVEPLIDITQKDWDKKLLKYFHRSDLVEAVKELAT